MSNTLTAASVCVYVYGILWVSSVHTVMYSQVTNKFFLNKFDDDDDDDSVKE